MTWQVGDKAIRARPAEHPLNQALDGVVYTVASIVYGGLGLTFVEVGHPNHAGYFASSFRKIRPDEQEGSAEDWQLLLETSKRSVPA